MPEPHERTGRYWLYAEKVPELAFFAGRLAELRRERGLTQIGLTDLIPDLGANTVAKLECGAIPNPSWGMVLMLARALGVSVESFTRPPTTASVHSPAVLNAARLAAGVPATDAESAPTETTPRTESAPTETTPSSEAKNPPRKKTPKTRKGGAK
jgi:transcriptional regulator with XRE-family HTH domain